jgi:alkanesulfonate monooxygenase SsuD/methylene tetrahydromethanopterin reductase-like flavin-dependent oxidoreductase (luciferase family)
MKVHFFHLMPYPELPENFENEYHSHSVDVPNALFDPERGNAIYNEYLDELEFAETAGFDGICVNEHHQNAYGMMPSPNILAATLARRTTRANIVVLGNSIALYNPPTRVAEEFALLDVISGGRLVAGFPVGTSADTNYCYGVPPAIIREKYYEAEKLIVKAWTQRGAFAFNGKYTKLRYVNIWPRPVQQPHPPIWVPGGGSVETWDWTLEKDYVYAALSYAGFKWGHRTLSGYWSRVEALNKDPNPYRAGYLQLVCVSDSFEQAEREYGPAVEYFFHKFAVFGEGPFMEGPGYRSERSIRYGFGRSNAQIQQRKQLAFRDVVEEGNVIAGSPDQVAERLREVCTDLRVGQLMVLLHIGNMPRDLVAKNTELFGTRVIPQLRDLWSEYEDRWSPHPMPVRAAPHPMRLSTEAVTA